VAREQIEGAIRQYPDFADAHVTFGDLLFVQGHTDAAIEAYKQALRLDPSRSDVRGKRDRILEMATDSGDGSTEPSRPAEDSPRRRMAFQDEIAKALRFENEGEQNKAEDIYRDILKRDPDHVEATRFLARIAVKHDRYKEAEVFLLRAVKNAPDYGRAWVDLCNVQRELEKFDEAEKSANEVLRLGPDIAESHMVYAGVVGMAGRHEEAIESYRKALEIDESKVGAISSIAHLLKTIGRHDEAVAKYRESIVRDPAYTEAFWSLANLKTYDFEDSEIEMMEGLLADESLKDESRVHLHNALGFAYEAREDYDRAFSNFDQCCTMRRQAESYDPVQTEHLFDHTIAMFNDEFFSARSGCGCDDDSPIFIVGLPRSGSTLLEQILSSHSEVEGTHELSDLSRVIQITRRETRQRTPFPEVCQSLEPADWSRIGEYYVERTQRFRSGSSRFIDKNPNNFTSVGVIALALPDAKIINARRHPLDSCFGTYKQLFAQGQPFSYDLNELGEYYLQYQRLMGHWHEVLPGKVLDVQYEEVVGDLDTQVRRILDYCGLPFEEVCLRFYETERAIKTASSEQVRRPIYSSSVNLWRKYESHLGELIQVLEPLIKDLPEADRPKPLAVKQ